MEIDARKHAISEWVVKGVQAKDIQTMTLSRPNLGHLPALTHPPAGLSSVIWMAEIIA
jgi:hypothetical protein